MEADETFELKIRVSRDTYEKLKALAERKGFTDVSALIEEIVKQQVLGPEAAREVELEKLRQKLERRLQDELNKSLSVIDSLRRQLTELYERVDHIESVVKELSEKKAEAKPPPPVQRGRAYKTGIERLSEDKILFESTLPPRIQRDAFFSYLEREGAVVLKLSRERIAVDRGFWEEFKEKLFKTVTTNKEDEIKQALGEKGFALWRALYDDNLIIYDPKTRVWKPLFKNPE
ncbi:ribbon-helix-helix protein, CopG family [Thermosphaera chiliense]|uniref:Ribbon-helix-helix protein, CopG family n=2 Tax=Thermosphaera chiliense TaxID=3402707 RepID=A0A7M1US41_9CREN|nr:ribbon-helix-helix protein, CopG family [Thermosphaera aggregans]